jgi:hypothetical protein
VEPGEVEAVLAGQPGVDQSVVVARDGRLIGYVVSDVDPVLLRDQVARVLPEYMVPAEVIALAALPVTANGKVDREALPDPDFSERVAGREPRTEVERALCELFAEVLGLERVGVDDSFFELGGDSIYSVKLAARAQRAGMAFTVVEVFEHRTPAGLATIVDSGGEPATRPAEPASDSALLDLDQDEIEEFEAEFDDVRQSSS